MDLLNILVKVSTFAPIDYTIELNFIGDFIEWLINLTSVGVGIILFTLVLKIIVLPFDVYSKIKNKKNAMKMEAMRGDLEKLQKQYANNKQLYQQKMMALQKKNGYSPLAGCLPMILSLVIFIIAINAFRSFSAYAMMNEYNDIVTHYNTAVRQMTVDNDDNVYFTENAGTISVDGKVLYNDVVKEQSILPSYKGISDIVDSNYKLVLEGNNFRESATALLDVIVPSLGSDQFLIKKDEGATAYTFKGSEADKQVLADHVLEVMASAYVNEVVLTQVNSIVKENYESGDINVSSFLWVKNVWMPDVSYEHPLPPDYSTFQQRLSQNATKSCSCETTLIPVDETTYNMVTAGLSEQKQQSNGYFIMVALSILTTFLSQFIMQRMQKSQLELQSVDSQAMMTQKMMMWMMPIMFGFFAFSYSTAFSIYMTISSLTSTLSSVIIHFVIERKYKKPIEVDTGRSKKQINQIEKQKAEAEEKARQKELEKQEKKNAKNKQKPDHPGNDFLEGNNKKRK